MKRLSTFRRGFASTFLLDVIARGLSAVTTVVLLRALSVGDFAFVILLLNAAQFLTSAATGGLRLRYTRMEAERVSRGLPGRSSFYLTIRGGAALVVMAGLLGFAGASVLGLGDSAGQRAALALLGVGYTLGHASVELAVFHHQAQLAFTRGGRISIARSSVVLAVAVAAAFGALQSGPEVGVALMIGVGCLALVASGPLAWSTRRSVADKEGRFGFGRESGALTLYSLASAGWTYGSIFLVAALLDDVGVAAFGAAQRYGSIITGPIPALVSVLRVRTAQEDFVDSDRAQRDFMVSWARRSWLPVVAVVGVAAIAAPFAIPIVDGGKYPLSVPVFEVLLLGVVVKLINLPNVNLLITQKRYTLVAWVNAAALAAMVGGTIAIAGPLGVVGITGVATAIAFVQMSALTYFALRPPVRHIPDGPPEERARCVL
ncbi:MAG: lipopolysaccharide biosynthesis protein [Thermoleophilaceae bacterium]